VVDNGKEYSAGDTASMIMKAIFGDGSNGKPSPEEVEKLVRMGVPRNAAEERLVEAGAGGGRKLLASLASKGAKSLLEQSGKSTIKKANNPRSLFSKAGESQSIQRFESKLDKYGNRRKGGSFKTPKEKQLEKLQLQKEKEIALKRKTTMDKNQERLATEQTASRGARLATGIGGVTLLGLGANAMMQPDVADSSPEALQAMQNAPGASVSGVLGDGVTSQGAAAPTGTGVANSELDVIPQVRGQQAGQINATPPATPPPVNAGAPEKRMDKKGGIDWWSMLKPVVAGVAGTAIAGKFGGKDAAAGFAQGFGNTLETRRGEQRQDKLAQEKQAREDKKSANENFWLGVQMGIPEMAQVNLDKMGDITEEERIAYKEAIGSANTRKSEMQRSNESAAKLKHLQMAGAYVEMGMLGDAVTLINSAQPDESLHVTEGTLLGGKRREMEEMLIKTYVTANGAMPDKANMDMIKDTVLNMYKSVSQRQSEAVLATLAEKVKESIDAGDIVTIKKLLESKPDMNPELRKMLLDAQTKIEQLGRSRTPDETAYDIGESIGNLPNQIGQAAGSVTPNSVMDFLPNIFPSTHLLNTVSQAGGAGNLRQAIPNILRGAGGGNR
jgi:hypothetical protein